MRTRKTDRERDTYIYIYIYGEREGGRGTDKVCVWMHVIETKIVSERENMNLGEGEVVFMHQRLI